MLEVIIDDKPAQRVLRDMQGRFARMMPANVRPISKLIREAMEHQFESEGAYGGNPWVALSDATMKRRTGGGKILVNTGNMRDSFTVADHENQLIDASGGKLIFEVANTPARHHQEGHGHLPVREVVPEKMPDDFMRNLRNLISGYIVGARF